MSQNNFEDEDRQMCRSSTGRFWEPISLLKKSHGKKPSQDEIKGITPEEVKKGFNNEKLFRAMFNELIARGNLPKEYGVRKASRNQDEKFKIDSWIDINVIGSKHSIPIQVKSSKRGKHEFIKKFGERVAHIYIIVMDEDITLLCLLRRIFSIVATDLKRQNLTGL